MAAEIPHLYSSMMFNGVPNKVDCPVQLATFDIVGLAAGIIFDNVNLGFINPKLFVFYFGEVLFSGLRWSYNVVPSFKLVKIAIVFGLSTMNHSCSSYWHQLSLGTGAPPGNKPMIWAPRGPPGTIRRVNGCWTPTSASKSGAAAK